MLSASSSAEYSTASNDTPDKAEQRHAIVLASLETDPDEALGSMSLEDSPKSPDQYGWFEETEAEPTVVRNAWLDLIRRDTFEEDRDTVNADFDVLFLWENTRPAIANKFLSSSELDLVTIGMNLSGCVSGFRIVNRGTIHAQFCVIFSGQ